MWGRWDLNPGPPAPQAGILDHSRQNCTKIHRFCKLDDDPAQSSKYEDLIINTLIKAQNSGKAKNTLISISHSLRQISKHADLMNPEEVKTYLAHLNVSNATKTKLCFGYNWFCKTNSIQWEKPKYKWERKIPLIPTTENIDKIISASSRKYATIFTILKETGLEAHELATTQRKDIDAQNGIINAQGCKGHNSRSFKLKQQTAEMLRSYLTEHTTNNPFPNSHAMGEAWRKTRDRLAKNLNEPQLKNIPMRNLRHYYATTLYDKTKDILLVKQRLGHKKIETTMFYTN
ncbi:MAG: tyrosine-type recombinase/integrase [Candidatus Bathyarchaeota archaeon]|nr:tyrosine-type recombinase/integrase [Candidatus Bathyarchaeota archaeon]